MQTLRRIPRFVDSTNSYSNALELKFDFQIITQVHEKKLRPTLPPNTPKELSSIVYEGWDHDRSKRPEVGELIKRLEGAKEVYKKNVAAWDALIKKK